MIDIWVYFINTLDIFFDWPTGTKCTNCAYFKADYWLHHLYLNTFLSLLLLTCCYLEHWTRAHGFAVFHLFTLCNMCGIYVHNCPFFRKVVRIISRLILKFVIYLCFFSVFKLPTKYTKSINQIPQINAYSFIHWNT